MKLITLKKKKLKNQGIFFRSTVVSAKSPLPYCDVNGYVICQFCNEKFLYENLPSHFMSNHGFSKKQIELLDHSDGSKSKWLNFVQGGLPSLGKKRK